MLENRNGRGASKVYCTFCDQVFDSRALYKKHVDGVHSYGAGQGTDSGDVSCESCPLDTAISKLLGLFRRKN